MQTSSCSFGPNLGPNDEAIPVKDKSGVYTIGWRIVKADRAKLSVDY